MDQALINWARSVKRASTPPPLWLFTEPGRTPDLCALAASLPPGLCGVVFRHDNVPDRLALGAKLAKICKARRIALVVAGDARLAAKLHAGLHLRGGRRQGGLALPQRGFVTASVHNRAETIRSRRAGADILFCSPVFATQSHPGARTLGPIGLGKMAKAICPAKLFALGGIDGVSIRALAKICAGAGAIDAFYARNTLREFQTARQSGKAQNKHL